MCGNNCSWILIIILLLVCCGGCGFGGFNTANNGGCGCGCGREGSGGCC